LNKIPENPKPKRNPNYMTSVLRQPTCDRSTRCV